MNERSAATELLLGFGVTVAGRIAGRAAQMATQAVLARVLGVEVFGLYTIAWSAVRMAGMVACFGVPRALVRHGWGQGDHGLAWRPTGWLLLGLGVLAATAGGALFWLGRAWMGIAVFGQSMLADAFGTIAPSVAGLAMLGILGGLARAQGRHGVGTFVQEAIQPWIGLLLVIAASGAGLDLAAAIGLVNLSCALAVVVGIGLILPRTLRLPRAHEPWSANAGSALRFTCATALAGSFASVNLWTDRLMLGALQPASEAGLYQAAAQIAMLFTILGASIANASEPGAVRPGAIKTTYRTGVRGGWHIALPLAVLIVLQADTLLRLIYGESFTSADLCLVILTMGGLVGVAAGPASIALIMGGRARLWLTVVVPSTLGNIGLNLVFIPRWGAEGAALATALAQLPALVVGLAVVRRVHGLRLHPKGLVKPALAALAAGCVLGLLDPGPAMPAIVRVALAAVIVFATYGLVLASLGLEPDEARFLGRLRAHLRPRPA